MKNCIVFTGGGTGGHVFPGLAVIDELKQRWEGRIIWIGSYSGMEKKIISRRNICFRRIPAGKMRRYISIQNFLDIFKILAGIVCSFFILLKERPGVIFSKGGYVSVPVVFTGFLLRIPVITHESDFDPGIANKINAVFVKTICTSFKETINFFPQRFRKKIFFTGNPVRSSIEKGDPVKGRQLLNCPEHMKILLILGGSLGALAINNAILKILDQLTGEYFIVHQMGEKNFHKTEKNNYYPVPFFNREFPHVLAAADLVVSRAGANTLWELTATGTPSILVPLSRSGSRGDQLRNAKIFNDLGVSLVLEQDESLSKKLLDTITDLLDNNSKLEEMRFKARSVGANNARNKIANILIKEIS